MPVLTSTDESVGKEERKGERQRAAAAEEDEPADEDGGEPEDPQFLNAPEPRPSPDLEDKYIVFQANLMQLFESCPRCSHPAKAFISKTVGSCIHVRQDCSKCCFFREWTSQPYIKQMPCGNLLLSSAVVLSGCSPKKILRLFYLLNVRYILESTFFWHQRHFIFSTVERKWKREQSELISQLQDEGRSLELIGDGRSDSPGHCAKYGTYTLIEQGLGKVLDIQIVQEMSSSGHQDVTWLD
ncbi:uncharacterized protein [Littorina saxatilis]|uniref:uncharacterized protein n=1 Tax=Littorina saxatilis TaxID=31220 RepID=UPI0038B54199